MPYPRPCASASASWPRRCTPPGIYLPGRCQRTAHRTRDGKQLSPGNHTRHTGPHKPRVAISYSLFRLAESCLWLNRIKVTAPRS